MTEFQGKNDYGLRRCLLRKANGEVASQEVKVPVFCPDFVIHQSVRYQYVGVQDGEIIYMEVK